MIVQETVLGNLILTKSDSGFTILQSETGLEYDEAIDVWPLRYSYTETENRVQQEA